MLDILSGGLLGSIFGGLFRMAPEVLKFYPGACLAPYLAAYSAWLLKS